jgi:hypothetical protein
MRLKKYARYVSSRGPSGRKKQPGPNSIGVDLVKFGERCCVQHMKSAGLFINIPG